MALFKKKEKYVPVKGLLGDATDYNIYEPKFRERVVWFVIGMIVGGAVLYIFYENILVSLVVGAVCGVAFVPIRTVQVINKRKKRLNLQFRGMLETLSTSIGAGKNMHDAFAGAAYDLAVQFGDDAEIVEEAKIVYSGLINNMRVEDLLLNFAERSGLDDVRNFANVFATCYKKGGNIKEVIKNTATIISDKIEIHMELETMVAGQKNEQNIMLVMPVIFILVLKGMGGDLVDLKSPIGIISVSISLAIFVLAYVVSRKILNIKL